MNQLVICQYNECNKYLLDPIFLSCSNNVCRTHIDELVDQTKEDFICFVCNEKHYINKEGFKMNKILNDIILLNFHLNDETKKAAELVDNLKKSHCELEKIINDPGNFIYENISEVRNKIDLERERLIDEINTVSDEMLNKLKQYEDECKTNLEKLNETKEQHKNYLTNLTNDISKWNELLRTPTSNEETIDELINEAEKKFKEIEEMISNHKKELMMNNKCSFKPMNTKLDEQLFGDFNILCCDYFKSSILEPNQFRDLIKLCEFNIQSKFKLLYQATKDGFSSADFHSKCDGIPNTLSIIKVKDKANIFGGFCSATWENSNEHKHDLEAFIFSLINQDNLPLKIHVTDPSKAIVSNDSYLQVFGGAKGNDIVISNNSNRNKKSYSNLGSSYKNNLYSFGTYKAQNFLAGSLYFTTEEIEVFEVI